METKQIWRLTRMLITKAGQDWRPIGMPTGLEAGVNDNGANQRATYAEEVTEDLWRLVRGWG